MRATNKPFHIEKTVWSACLPDGSRVRRESHARFCERPAVKFHRPTQPHICGTSQKAGKFAVQRKTIGKRMAAKLKDIKAKLRQRMHESIKDTLKCLQSVVRGYFRYHAIPGNEQRLRAFRKDVLRLWLRQLRRRSQRSRWTWKRFMERLAVQIPEIHVVHPYPGERFDAKHPR